jgi:hypothetical protein
MAANKGGGFAWLVGLLLPALVLLVYGGFLDNPLVFDDLYTFMLDGAGHSAVFQFSEVSWLTLRSLPYATLAWTAEWFGFGLPPFRLGNLFLHVVTSLTLFGLLRVLLRAVLPESRQAVVPWVAFFAALLFSLHPVAVYGVAYLVQRTTLMATLFSLLALLSYLHGRIAQRRRSVWLAVVCYYFAAFSKEHAVMLPAVLVALEVLLYPDWPQRMRRHWPEYAALALVALLVVWQRTSFIGAVVELEAGVMLQGLGVAQAYPMSVLTQCWLFFKYVWLWLLPNPEWMSVDMREPFAVSWMSPYLLAPLLFLAWGGVGLHLLRQRGEAGVLGFAMLFPWLMFMTELSSVRIQEPFVLYRSYLWAAGGIVAVPLLLSRLRRPLALTILSLFALACVPLTIERLGTFAHPFQLWDDAEKLVRGRDDRVGAYRIYYNRGTECIKFLDFRCAESDLKRSIELYPGLAEAHGNLGSTYLQTARYREAKQYLTQAIAIETARKKSNWRHYWWRAQANESLGLKREAIMDYAVTCLINRQGCDKAGLLPPQRP